MSKRRWFAAAVAAVMLAGASPAWAQEPVDWSEDTWAGWYDGSQECDENGLVVGTTDEAPTRDEDYLIFKNPPEFCGQDDLGDDFSDDIAWDELVFDESLWDDAYFDDMGWDDTDWDNVDWDQFNWEEVDWEKFDWDDFDVDEYLDALDGGS